MQNAKPIFIPPFRKPVIASGLAMLELLLMSFNPPSLLAAATPAPQPSPTPLPLLETPTAPPSTTTLAPSSTSAPPLTATPAPLNIVFATGMTTAVEQGTLSPNQVQAYTLSAMANQLIILVLNSTNNDLYLGVTEPDGNMLLDPAKKMIELAVATSQNRTVHQPSLREFELRGLYPGGQGSPAD